MRIIHWGMIDCQEALMRQKILLREVIDGDEPALITCEHPPVLSLGRAHDRKNILLPEHDLRQRGISIISVDRGGDVTLHAPGQLVVYPVMDLKTMGRDVGAYLRKLEEACVAFLKDFDIVAEGDDSRRGVWAGAGKIASIGIGVSRWVSYHGMGINVSTDLELFRLIRPCGLDVAMVSVQSLTGKSPSMADAAERFAGHWIKVAYD